VWEIVLSPRTNGEGGDFVSDKKKKKEKKMKSAWGGEGGHNSNRGTSITVFKQKNAIKDDLRVAKAGL